MGALRRRKHAAAARPTGAALESAPERAVAARRFRFRVAAQAGAGSVVQRCGPWLERRGRRAVRPPKPVTPWQPTCLKVLTASRRPTHAFEQTRTAQSFGTRTRAVNVGLSDNVDRRTRSPRAWRSARDRTR